MSAPNDRPHFRHWPARLPREIGLPNTTLWFNLAVTAQRYPHKTAFVFFGQRLTYAALFQQAQALAGWLQQVAGVQRGDRVVLYMQNCPQFVVAYYAILRADAVVVPVNPMNRAEELRHQVVDPQARVAVCAADLADRVITANRELSDEQRLRHVVVCRLGDAMPAHVEDPADEPPPAMAQWLHADPVLPVSDATTLIERWADALSANLEPAPPESRPDDLAVLPYTSGTTGLPKGCMHTHRTLMHNIVGGGLWGCATTESVSLGVVPLFHITGMIYGMHAPIYTGSTVVLLPRWDRELAGRWISRYQVSHWTCIPTMIIDLLGSPNAREFDLSSLRYLSGGGAAMPQAVAERLKAEFGLSFAEGYGLTETAAPSHANPPERAKLQCLGMPIFGTDARVVDPVTLQEMPPGEVGEIIVHGPQVFVGYWRQPQASEQAFVDFEGRRFFRTGDLGRMDDEGYFFITDRLKRMINASGFKVWPAEVETLLFRHPAVQEACVIAALDAYRGETVKAVVVLRDAAKGKVREQDIIDWAREHMAAYKYPRVVEFVDELPKSGAGKVMWRVLQERERQGPAAV